MANAMGVSNTEVQGGDCLAFMTDGLHMLYYAASTLPDFPGERPGATGFSYGTDSRDQVEDCNATGEGNRGVQGLWKGSKEKMKPGLCSHCGVTEATAWRCIVRKNPHLGHFCNPCAVHLRSKSCLPDLLGQAMQGNQLISCLAELARREQVKAVGSPCIGNKRAACEVATISDTQVDGNIKRSCTTSEGEDIPANGEDSSEGTVHQLDSQSLMMGSHVGGAGSPSADKLSLSSFTIPAYTGGDGKQPKRSRQASKGTGHLLAVMNEQQHDEDSSASGEHSQTRKKKRTKCSRSKRSCTVAEPLQLQQPASAMQEDTHNSGSAQTAGLLSGMQAMGQVAPPPPPPSLSLPSPAPTTAQQFAFANPNSLLPMPMLAGYGRNAQCICMMPIMVQPGVSMAWGQHMPAPAMFAQPGWGMAYQGYAMQQLQQGQLSTAMSWVGNTSTAHHCAK